MGNSKHIQNKGKAACFFDIDGTLWDYKHAIPQSTISAVREIRANGHYAFIASGRSRGAIIDKDLLGIGFDGIIAGGGSYIEFENGEIAYEYIIEPDEVERLRIEMERLKLAYIFEARNSIYVHVEAFGDDDAYIKSLEVSLKEHFKDKKEINEDSHINKLSVDARDCDEGIEAVYKLFDSEKYEIIVHEKSTVAEIMPKGHSKGTGILKICELLDVPVENTYAFGDSANDIEMLKTAAHSVAMGDGAMCARETAEYVTTGLHEDGIMLGLKHYGLL